MAVVKTIGVVLGLCIFILWGYQNLPHLSLRPAATIPATQAASVAVVSLHSDDGPVALDGTITFDTGSVPPVPYLVYTRPDGSARTKELIWNGERGCATHDGDLPCLAGYQYPYPKLSPGEQVHVTGTIVGDQILVDSVQQTQ